MTLVSGLTDPVGIIGAAGGLGTRVGVAVTAALREPIRFSRTPANQRTGEWRALVPRGDGAPIAEWISCAPIVTVGDWLPVLESYGAKKIVAFSSTSIFTKEGSRDAHELAFVRRLVDGEAAIAAWGERAGGEWVILRPTLIYGHNLDRNISEIANIARRFGFFPLYGAALGKRRPVHFDDLAAAAIAALRSDLSGKIYTVSGGEVLTYAEMVSRIIVALGQTPRTPHLPKSLFRAALVVLRQLPRYADWTGDMVDRMNLDMDFDHSEAMRDLGFAPRGFALQASDLPTVRK